MTSRRHVAFRTDSRAAPLRAFLRHALDCGPAAALPGLPRAAGRRRRAVRRLLGEAFLHRAAVLRAARHSLHLRSRARACCRWRRSPQPPAYDRARAAVRYDEIARALVLSFKYGDRLDLAPMLGRWMARAGGELHAGCRRAGAGAAALASIVVAPLQPVGGAGGQRSAGNAACRCSTTRSSACGRRRSRWGCRRPQRADNVQGAFRVPAERKALVAGRRLVLVDDVLTSGATVDACARALLRAGAAHVDVLVFARVVAPVRSPI